MVELTPQGRAVLQNPALLSRVEGKSPPAQPATAAQAGEDELTEGVDTELYDRLVAWRLETARAARLPRFCIAQNVLLRRIAAARPRTESELRAIKGIGPHKLEHYGAAILALVNGEDAKKTA